MGNSAIPRENAQDDSSIRENSFDYDEQGKAKDGGKKGGVESATAQKKQTMR